MFSELSPCIYQGRFGREYLWQTADEKYYFSAALLGGNVVRVQALRQKPEFTTRYQLTDGGPGTLPYHSWSVSKGDEQWTEFVEDEAQVRSLLEPYLREFSFSADAIRLSHPLAVEEHIFGLGERTGTMDKRGQAFPIWNIDPPQHHSPKTVTMYTSIPFYLGYDLTENRASGVFIDYTGRVDMDLGQSQPDRALSTIKGDSFVAYFLLGSTSEKVLNQFTELTGRMPLPPRWALGHHQARWSYPSEQNVRKIAKKLREGKHPTDAIWLDIDYMDGYRNFTWDPNTFPDPASLTKDLHQQGLHLVTIVDPGTKVDPDYSVYKQGVEQDFFCHNPDGSLFVGQVWPGDCHFPDFSNSEVRKWWGDLYKNHLEMGVDGIWNDMDEPALTDMFVNKEEEQSKAKAADESRARKVEQARTPEETQARKAEQAQTYRDEIKEELSTERWLAEKTMPGSVLHRAGDKHPTGPDGAPTTHAEFHNAYGLEMARSTYEGLLRLRPDQRPFVLTRSGTAGIQRYAAVWTGDNSSNWEHIQMAISMCLNLGISGVPFVGMDVGGFWGNSNGEMLVRFAQLGALLPFFRNHNEISSIDQEPWAFGEPYESAYRAAVETRYRLLPYIYDAFYEASRTGTPIIRPLYYHFPNDERALFEETAFLIGPNLLSAPVSQGGATSREVYLPEGGWIDFWDGTHYHGNVSAEINAPLERWPLFVRQNSILPTLPVMQHVDQVPDAPLTFTCYMGGDGEAAYTLYEDDGSSLAYQRGEYAEIRLSCGVTTLNAITVEIEEHFHKYRPRHKHYELIVHYGGQVYTKQLEVGKGKQVIRF